MVVGLLSEQRKRLVASLLGSAEQSSWWRHLSPAEQRDHRAKVLASVGVFADFMRDVIKVSDDGSVRNELALDLIQKVYEGQRTLERRLSPRA